MNFNNDVISVIIILYRVAYVARRFARSLQQQLKKDRERAKKDDESMYEFDDKEVLCAEIAGLCHDLGTIILQVNLHNAWMSEYGMHEICIGIHLRQ